MLETVLIDGDIVAYRCAAATANEHESIACYQASEMMQRILHETNALGHKCFLTGSNNFRFGIYPDYKANRKDLPKPVHLQCIRAHLVTQWGAVVSDGVEADDLMGIEQCAAEWGQTTIATIDKDLLMIPGLHYNFVTGKAQSVTPLEGLRNFYLQLIMGDRSDNIPGYDGKMRIKVPQFLYPAVDQLNASMNEFEMFEHVRNMYNDDEKMLMSGQCLWIQRKENDLWKFPVERVDTSETQGFHYIGSSGSVPKVSSEV